MRLALQRRLLASPSRTSILHRPVRSGDADSCPYHPHPPTSQGQSRRYTAKDDRAGQHLGSEARSFRTVKLSAATKDSRQDNGASEHNRPPAPRAQARLPDAQGSEGPEGAALSVSRVRERYRLVPSAQRNVPGGDLSSETQPGLPNKATEFQEGWRRRLTAFEQYQYQSDFEAPVSQGPRLVDSPSYAQDWQLWLELIAFRRRQHGAIGTMAIYREIFRRGLRLPTQGTVANQLWDLLIQAGFHDVGLLKEILIYAMFLKASTKRSWPHIYSGILSIALKVDPSSAYDWHVKVRDDFPPSLEDYQRLFKLSIGWGSAVHFRGLYVDAPLTGMYKTVIRQLCELQMYPEALRWHDLLCQAGDFPTESTDIQPLLDHLVYIGERSRFENIIKQLAEAEVGIRKVAEDYAQRDKAITSEIMNRKLGEAHGIAPTYLSDSFCARLFATQFFAVDTIIKGLHMIAAEMIGPLSLREIAFRDDCDPAAICRHLDVLKTAGVTLDNSPYCTTVRSLAVENKGEILKSIVDSDLHPDTFGDDGLQERLLAQYFEEDDVIKIERTLAILTTGCSFENLQRARTNLILRSQVTLGRQEQVLAMIEEMKHLGIAVSPRSSRHLRVCWLSRRSSGRGPRRTKELAILIQASQMTMQSGSFVPIYAWREILRRLGMEGRLMELENLALWLVDSYSSPAAKAALSKRILPSTHRSQALVGGEVSSEESPDFDPKHYLNTLFTTSARHAIVAWGFQQTGKPRKSIRRLVRPRTVGEPPKFEKIPQFQWTWGLHLLYKLKERGLPIEKSQVAQICRDRLDNLFGTGCSKRPINRRARSENLYSEEVYVRKMEEIWGRDLFKVWEKRWRPRKTAWRRRRFGAFRAWRPLGMNSETRTGRQRYPTMRHSRIKRVKHKL